MCLALLVIGCLGSTGDQRIEKDNENEDDDSKRDLQGDGNGDNVMEHALRDYDHHHDGGLWMEEESRVGREDFADVWEDEDGAGVEDERAAALGDEDVGGEGSDDMVIQVPSPGMEASQNVLEDFRIEPELVVTNSATAALITIEVAASSVAGLADNVREGHVVSQVILQRPDGTFEYQFFTPKDSLVEGDRFDGLYRWTLSISPYGSNGQWLVSTVYLVDETGAYSSNPHATLLEQGFTASFTVSGSIIDTEAPILHHLSFDGTVLRVRISDVGSGILWAHETKPRCHLKLRSLLYAHETCILFLDEESREGGDASDAVFWGTIPLEPGTLPSSYVVRTRRKTRAALHSRANPLLPYNRWNIFTSLTMRATARPCTTGR